MVFLINFLISINQNFNDFVFERPQNVNIRCILIFFFFLSIANTILCWVRESKNYTIERLGNLLCSSGDDNVKQPTEKSLESTFCYCCRSRAAQTNRKWVAALQMVEEKARSILTKPEFTNLCYYTEEYSARHMTIDAFVQVMIELLNAPDKVSTPASVQMKLSIILTNLFRTNKICCLSRLIS